MKKGLSIIAAAITVVATSDCEALAQRADATVGGGGMAVASAPDQWQDPTVVTDTGCRGGYAGCDSADGVALSCAVGCPPRWAHRNSLFGEFLYLRARDAEIAYAAPVDGPTTPPGNPGNPGNQVGRLAIVDPDYQPAYRVGFERACDNCSGIRASFSRFESSTSGTVREEPDEFIQSLVTHPGVLNAEDNWLQAGAVLDVTYELVDVDYRWLAAHGDLHAVNLLAGARYGELAQDFQSLFAFNGSRMVDTRVCFEGAGLRLGVEADRFAPCSGWMVYGRGVASFLAGDFRADYFQDSSFASPEIDTSWKAGRVVSILDLELGVGWTGPYDRLRLRAGYLFSAWFNTVQTDAWIDAVNANHFTDLGGSTMSFDGFTAQVEYRF